MSSFNTLFVSRQASISDFSIPLDFVLSRFPLSISAACFNSCITPNSYGLFHPEPSGLELVKLKLNDEEDYLKRFERCFELLNNISEQINNKPINVEILNHDLTEYKALKEDLFINIDNCQSIINEIDRMVLELNKLRDGFKDINDEIVKAENLYKKSYYVESYDILKKLYDSRKELLNN